MPARRRVGEGFQSAKLDHEPGGLLRLGPLGWDSRNGNKYHPNLAQMDRRLRLWW